MGEKPTTFWHSGGDELRSRVIHHLRALFDVPALARSGALERLQAQYRLAMEAGRA